MVFVIFISTKYSVFDGFCLIKVTLIEAFLNKPILEAVLVQVLFSLVSAVIILYACFDPHHPH